MKLQTKYYLRNKAWPTQYIASITFDKACPKLILSYEVTYDKERYKKFSKKKAEYCSDFLVQQRSEYFELVEAT